MIICFDGDYPELSRIQAVQGAEVICRPSALLRSADIWELTSRARAYDNHVFVVGANAVGRTPPGVLYFGNSHIVTPIGHIVAKAASHEGWVSARLDPDDGAVVADAGLEHRPGLRPPARPQPRPHPHPPRGARGPGEDVLPARLTRRRRADRRRRRDVHARSSLVDGARRQEGTVPRTHQARQVSPNGPGPRSAPELGAQCRATGIRQAGDVGTGRPGALEERLPVVVERREPTVAPRRAPWSTSAEARAVPERRRGRQADRAASSPRPADTRGRAGPPRPTAPQHAHPAAVVPHGSGEHARGSGDPQHLGHRPLGIGHEVEHEERERGVDAVVVERQCLGLAVLEADAVRLALGVGPGSGGLDEPRSRVDTHDLALRPPIGHRPGQVAGAGPDVEHPPGARHASTRTTSRRAGASSMLHRPMNRS